jgi:hypothetical protein
MNVGGSFMAIDQRNDVWMVEAFEDMNLRRQVVLQLLIQLREVDRLYGDIRACFLIDFPNRLARDADESRKHYHHQEEDEGSE